jgi:hypothetical protein
MSSSQLTEQQQRMVNLVHEIYDAWEHVEYILFKIFAELSKGPYSESCALYYCHRDNRARQRMVEAIAEDIFINEHDKLQELLKLTKRMRSASRKRNEVAHSAWRVTPDTTEYTLLPIGSDPKLSFMTISERNLQERLAHIRTVAKDAIDYYLRNRADWYRRRFDYCQPIAARGPTPAMVIL